MKAMGSSKTMARPTSHLGRQSPRKGQANDAATRFTSQPYGRRAAAIWNTERRPRLLISDGRFAADRLIRFVN